MTDSTIFIVDNSDPTIRDSLSWLLESTGHPVKTFENAQEFLDNFDPHAPGCQVLDARHTDTSGLRLQQKIDEMTTSIAHELNQPLAAISLYLQGCMKLSSLDENSNSKDLKIHSAIKAADEQATRAADIISRIKRIVRKENIETVDLNKLVHKSIELIFIGEQHACIQPQLQLTEQPILIDADSLQIEQVLVNLIRNATEAMLSQNTAHPQLTISTSVDNEGFAMLSIVDSGEGIPIKIKEKIFDRYFTTKAEGLGIGLSICRSIIEEHNGVLWYDTHRPQGAEFCFKLPLTSELHTSQHTKSTQ